MMFSLAAKHGVALPYASVEAVRAAYAFHDLQSFLDLYYAGLRRAARPARLLRARDGVLHARPRRQRRARRAVLRSADPHRARHPDRGRDRRPARCDGRRPAPLRHQLRADPVLPPPPLRGGRVRDARRGAAVPQRVRRRRARLRRARQPAVRSSRACSPRRAALGLRAVAHAGEEGPAAYITEALDLLRVERIDHGVRCDEDPALVERLVREQIPLTVCPLSNLKLCVVKDLAQHNFAALLRKGVAVTINSRRPRLLRRLHRRELSRDRRRRST